MSIENNSDDITIADELRVVVVVVVIVDVCETDDDVDVDPIIELVDVDVDRVVAVVLLVTSVLVVRRVVSYVIFEKQVKSGSTLTAFLNALNVVKLLQLSARQTTSIWYTSCL